MKLENSTDFADHFLRRLVSWCCRQSGYPVRRLVSAKFSNTARSYSGMAYGSRRIRVSIGGWYNFPTSPDNRPGMQGESFADRIEALVAVTSHEIEHLCQYAEGRSRRLNDKRAIERVTRYTEINSLRLFRANRDALILEWSAEPSRRAVRPKPSRQELNEKRVRVSLARWETKLKTAQGKIRKLRAKARYYDRIAAKRGANG